MAVTAAAHACPCMLLAVCVSAQRVLAVLLLRCWLRPLTKVILPTLPLRLLCCAVPRQWRRRLTAPLLVLPWSRLPPTTGRGPAMI